MKYFCSFLQKISPSHKLRVSGMYWIPSRVRAPPVSKPPARVLCTARACIIIFYILCIYNTSHVCNNIYCESVEYYVLDSQPGSSPACLKTIYHPRWVYVHTAVYILCRTIVRGIIIIRGECECMCTCVLHACDSPSYSAWNCVCVYHPQWVYVHSRV